jgi:DnaK suppressor protein
MQNISQNLQDELHKRLIREEAEIIERIEELKADDPFLNPDHVNDNAAVDTDVREQMGHDTIEAQVTSLERKLEYIRAAFKKMQKKSFGLCENCQNPIAIERLKLIPEARYCIDCERKLIK